MKKRTISMLLAAALSLSMLAGCSSGIKPADTPTPQETQEAAVPSSAPETVTEPAEQTITDMFGREVTIPTKIESVYCAVPTGEAMVATLFQDMLVGWVNEPVEAELEFLSPELAELPAIGGWMGQKVTANMEDIIRLDPDVIIYMRALPEGAVDEVPDDIQDKTGIPVVAVSGYLEDTAYVYRLLGQYLGLEERGNLLAEYCEEKLAAVKAAVSQIPEDERVRVYYAEKLGGLFTDPSGSGHTEVLDYANVVNVADVEMLGGQGFTEVSIEQVINWNPDVILVLAPISDKEEIMNNPIWKDIKAMQDGRVYVTPDLPFNWFDRPPNIMRVLGLQWFANEMYPQYYDVDIRQEIKDFFQLFYNKDLTDADVDKLLEGNPEI